MKWKEIYLKKASRVWQELQKCNLSKLLYCISLLSPPLHWDTLGNLGDLSRWSPIGRIQMRLALQKNMKNHLCLGWEKCWYVSKINKKTKETIVFQNILKYYFVIYKLHISDFTKWWIANHFLLCSFVPLIFVPLTAIIAQTNCRFICCAR